MSDQDDLFTGDTPPVTTKTPEDLLASIKNENGEQKYKSLEDALKALEHSQAFIKTLQTEKSSVETEIQSLREKVAKIDSIDEVVRKLTANDEQNKRVVETPPASGLSEEAVAKLVDERLRAASSQARAVENVNVVNETLKTKFGSTEKAVEAVTKKATELGVTPAELKELAAKTPAMVLALFNSGTTQHNTPTTSSVRLPGTPDNKNEVVERPQKSVLSGATSSEQKDHFLRHRDAVYKKYGIEG